MGCFLDPNLDSEFLVDQRISTKLNRCDERDLLQENKMSGSAWDTLVRVGAAGWMRGG
jgi:hypothetical protein